MRNSCGVAILEDYEDLKKYNIKTLCQDPEEAKATKKGGQGGAASKEPHD